MSDEVGHGFGGGKVILFGEHAVVYGEPALVAGLPDGATAEASYGSAETTLRVTNPPGDVDVTLTGPREGYETWWRAFQAGLSPFEQALRAPVEVQVTVDIPIGVGLGSSAALGTAVARALAELTGREEAVDDAIRASEEVFHGDPSGIDQIAAKHGGVRFFRKDEPEAPPLEVPSFELAICQAAGGAQTSRLVEQVRGLREREPALVGHVLTWIGDVARKASESLRAGELGRTGELMDMNHGALVSLGVSTRQLDIACHVARDAGALGAKLTGAGGGGCVIGLATEQTAHKVCEAWSAEGFDCFRVRVGRDD